MTHKLTSTLFALVTATAAYADDGYGTAAEAMLQRAVIAMEADPAAALATFTAGEDGFRDRDLYVACLETDPYGVLTAHGAVSEMVGVPSANFVDKNGTIVVGQVISYSVEGEIKSATYWWPRPGEEEPSRKHMLHTMVAGQICAVGHYE